MEKIILLKYLKIFLSMSLILIIVMPISFNRRHFSRCKNKQQCQIYCNYTLRLTSLFIIVTLATSLYFLVKIVSDV